MLANITGAAQRRTQKSSKVNRSIILSAQLILLTLFYMNKDKNAWKAYHWIPLLINIDQMLLFSLCWKPFKDYLQKYYSAIDLKKPNPWCPLYFEN